MNEGLLTDDVSVIAEVETLVVVIEQLVDLYPVAMTTGAKLNAVAKLMVQLLTEFWVTVQSPEPARLIVPPNAIDPKAVRKFGKLLSDPILPVTPVDPADPVAPVAPVAPVGPVDPVAPVGPVGPPDGPVAPVNPVAPVAPVTLGPVGPRFPGVPAGPKAPFGPVAPVGPAGVLVITLFTV